jgi:hypothetical protein
MELVKAKGFTEVSSTVCATGGGAHKFEKLIEQVCYMIRFNSLLIILFPATKSPTTQIR